MINQVPLDGRSGLDAAMRLERVDPLAIDTSAAKQPVSPHRSTPRRPSTRRTTPVETAATRALYLRYGWENRPLDAVLLRLRDDDRSLIGLVYVELATARQPRSRRARASSAIPDHRDGEAPDELLDAGLAEAQGLRPNQRHSPMHGATPSGATSSSARIRGRLSRLPSAGCWMSQLDWAELDRAARREPEGLGGLRRDRGAATRHRTT